MRFSYIPNWRAEKAQATLCQSLRLSHSYSKESSDKIIRLLAQLATSALAFKEGLSIYMIYRESYMSAHVLLNLLNKLRKSDKMQGLPSI